MTLTRDEIGGLYSAIVTPFHDDGSIDFQTLTRLVRFQLDAGAAGTMPVGGTGEYPALSHSERVDVVRACVEASEGKHVLPGVLSTGYRDALASGEAFMHAGATGLMVITPYYALGSQQGMRQYFRDYRATLGVPVIAYDIPPRTGVRLEPETIAQMAEDGSVIGLKCSSPDMAAFLKIIHLAGDRLAILGGEERLLAIHVALGACGGVLGTSTIHPEPWLRILELAGSGRLAEAAAAQHAMTPLIEAIYREINPGPLKFYMKLAGMPVGDVRAPLTGPSQETIAMLEEILARGLPTIAG